SSASAAKVARGLVKTASARSHHSFWSDGVDSAAAVTGPAYCLANAQNRARDRRAGGGAARLGLALAAPLVGPAPRPRPPHAPLPVRPHGEGRPETADRVARAVRRAHGVLVRSPPRRPLSRGRVALPGPGRPDQGAGRLDRRPLPGLPALRRRP